MVKSKKKKSVAKKLQDDPSIPRSFVFRRGKIGTTLGQLVLDMRRVMEPYTAVKLAVRKSNTMKDFVDVAGPLGVTHFVIVSKTDLCPYMKLCRLARGPTLTFRINEYSLMRDVVSVIRRPKTISTQFKHPPLLVLNGFNSETREMKLMTTMLQNMYPPIKIQKVKLGEIRRCVMFNYDAQTKSILFRQYHIEAVPIGLSRGVKKLLRHKLPNLGTLSDISDFVNGSAYLSESEGEEPADSHVRLPQKLPGQGNIKSSQSAIRLTELGPRLTLELMKIEDGVCCGEVLFHKYVQKSAADIAELKKKKEKEKKLKEKRRLEQEKNVERKIKEKEVNKEKSLAGMKRKSDDISQESEDDDGDMSENVEENSDIDDADYYEQEVGEKPDEELFQKKSAAPKAKRVRFSEKPKRARAKTNQDVPHSRLSKKKFQNNSKSTENERKDTPSGENMKKNVGFSKPNFKRNRPANFISKSKKKIGQKGKKRT